MVSQLKIPKCKEWERSDSAMTRKLRWGILGCADIAINRFIPALLKSETGEIGAIASRDAARAAATAQTLGILKHYGDYRSLLADPNIDAVYIPLPNHLHCEWTIRSAEAGKHVLCEKPFAMNAKEAEAMGDACQSNGVRLAEALMYRHHARYDRVKEILQSGEIGTVRSFFGSFTFNITNRERNDIRFKTETGGGSIYDDGCYPVSAARYLLGKEPETVTVHSLFLPEFDALDMMNTALMEFPAGVGAILQFGMWCKYTNMVLILGTNGSIEIPTAFYYDPPAETKIVVTANDVTRVERFAEADHYVTEIDDFGHAVQDGTPLRFGLEDAVNNMKAVEACIRSSRERIRVSLN
jgi:xylose dehydrogenase (NAD/NADP)